MSTETKRHLQFVLASLGFASLLGSAFGAAWGYVRTVTCWCCNPEDQEPA